MADNLNEMNNNNPVVIEYNSKVQKQNELLIDNGNPLAEIKTKLNALEELQIQTTSLDLEFNKKVSQLVKEFEQKYQEIFTKKNEIIMGMSNEKCNFPDGICTDLELHQAIENLNLNSSNENEIFSDHQIIKEIPNFWYTILKNLPSTIGSHLNVQKQDEPILKHLTDVRSITIAESKTFILEFHFSPNEFFSNRMLTKQYFLKYTPDSDGYFSFDGPQIYKCCGCEINWYKEKNLIKKDLNKSDVDIYELIKLGKSFFNFFDPPIPLNKNDPLFDEINYKLEKDYEIGDYLKKRIIPIIRPLNCFAREFKEYLAKNEKDIESELNGGDSKVE